MKLIKPLGAKPLEAMGKAASNFNILLRKVYKKTYHPQALAFG